MHTKGPWKVGASRITVITSKFAFSVPHLGGETKRAIIAGEQECEANARLIAAAPDLLEALREMVSQFEPCDPGNDDGINDCDAIVLARAAIAKAEVQP